MKSGWRQYLSIQPAASATPEGAKSAALEINKHPALSWRDHVIMLLHIAAEIEHSLMVQYLYAAYSLGGPDVTSRDRQASVGRWRDNLVTVAKEEMGHLLTVQNILCLLGAPINLGREDYPWDVPFYPFPFSLEQLSRPSLACYIHAEMPPHVVAILKSRRTLPKSLKRFLDKDKTEIDRLTDARASGASVHFVATVYDQIIHILGKEKWIPDSAFNEDSYAFQASWDDWGRGYGPDPRMLDPGGSPVGTPAPQREANVIILRAATRTEALAALKAISGQGEALHFSPEDSDEPSHFERFLEVFQEFPLPGDWSPTRSIPTNPTTQKASGTRTTYIASETARTWAILSNFRYRMLLTCLAHSFRLACQTRPGEPNLRGVVMHRVFGEMYNLKTIAGILAELDAGPPFEMPYTLDLPETSADIWRLHRELLKGSLDVGTQLLRSATGEGKNYLLALAELDTRAVGWIDSILAGTDNIARGRA
jgi:hypothetical protein